MNAASMATRLHLMKEYDFIALFLEDQPSGREIDLNDC